MAPTGLWYRKELLMCIPQKLADKVIKALGVRAECLSWINAACNPAFTNPNLMFNSDFEASNRVMQHVRHTSNYVLATLGRMFGNDKLNLGALNLSVLTCLKSLVSRYFPSTEVGAAAIGKTTGRGDMYACYLLLTLVRRNIPRIPPL